MRLQNPRITGLVEGRDPGGTTWPRRGLVTVICLVLTSAGAPSAWAATKAPAKVPVKLSRALAIASESRGEVITLHDLSVSIGNKKGIPAGVVDSSAKNLQTQFHAQAAAARALAQPSSSATGALTASLSSYAGFAGEVSKAAASEGRALPADFIKELAGTDKRWETALSSLGRAAHVNLLKDVPKLLYPSAVH